MTKINFEDTLRRYLPPQEPANPVTEEDLSSSCRQTARAINYYLHSSDGVYLLASEAKSVLHEAGHGLIAEELGIEPTLEGTVKKHELLKQHGIDVSTLSEAFSRVFAGVANPKVSTPQIPGDLVLYSGQGSLSCALHRNYRLAEIVVQKR